MSRHRDQRRQREGDASSGDRRSGRDRSGFSHRYTSRYGGSDASARDAASEGNDRDTGGRMPERAQGGRRSTPHARRTGNARVGSQRGEDSVQGVSGRAGRQFGDLHGPRPGESESEGFHGEEQFGGEAGRSARDRRYGSRRGHGSERREDRRTDADG